MKKIVFYLILLIIGSLSYGQIRLPIEEDDCLICEDRPPAIPSAPSVSSNSCGNKTLTRGNPPSGVTWYWQTYSGGTSRSNSSRTYSVSSSRTVYLRARSNSSGAWSSSRSVSVTVTPGPPTPSTPSISSNSCGNKTLTRGNPPSGVTWYWQTSSGGTSTSNSSSTYTVTSSRTVYLRARKSNGCWGGSRSVGVTVGQAPPMPPIPSVSTNSCGNKTLTIFSGGPLNEQPIGEDNVLDGPIGGGPPSGVTWYWQGKNSNGTSTSNSNSSYTATSSGTYYIRARNSSGCWSSSRSINVTVGVIPSLPSTPSISTNNCGNKTLTRGNPPSGVTWYWQTSSGGTSTSNSSSTYSVSSSRTVYLRGRSSSGCWGGVRSVSVTVKPTPSTPSTPAISSNSCGNKTVTRGNPPSGVTWYWQTSSGGSSTGNSSKTYSVSSSRTVYLRAKSSNGCWSGVRSVSVTVKPNPATPPTPTISSNSCGNKTLTRSNPPSGVTWYWQTSSGGSSTGNSSATYSVSSTRTVYLRARSSNGCWSSSRSVGVTVNQAPGMPPTPAVSTNSCGNKTLTISSSGGPLNEQPIGEDNVLIGEGPPSGVTWYWQGKTSNGTSTSNSSSSYTATSSGTYYVRARNSSGCWSGSRSVNVTVNPIPGTPATPSISTNNCGNKTLTRGTPPSGVTWYWQTSSGGSSTANSSATYSVPSSRTVYLRARSSSGCWSGVRSVSVSVKPNPSTPPTPTISSNSCGNKTLTRGNPPSGVTWYWQTSSGGSSTSSSSKTYSVSSTRTVYLRAKSSNGCWSGVRSVSVTVKPNPSTPPTPTISPNSCGNKTLTRGAPPSGVTWYWQTSSGGSSTGNSSATYSVSSTRTVYLRAKSSNGCWSSSRSVGVTVNQAPDMPPTPAVSNNSCGYKTLTISSSGPILDEQPIEEDNVLDEPIGEGPPSGVIWYWQGTNSNGNSTANSTSNGYTASSSGTYYVRALNSAGCWSASRSVGVTVNSIPGTPPTPSISTNSCGNKTLTRGNPPSGVTWYWQTSSGGKSTSNSSSTYSVSSSKTVYLRAKSSSDCWSGSRSVVVSVNPVPDQPPVPYVSTNTCDDKTISYNSLPILDEQPIGNEDVDIPIDSEPSLAPPSGVTWYWQGTDADGTSTTNSASSAYAITSSGTYYVRARSSAGCWSAIRSVGVTVNQTPDKPSTPTVSPNNCGNKTLTRGTPPSGVTWFWQTSSSGTSTTNFSATYGISISGTYYLRARSGAGCWSDSRSVGVIVNEIPDIPPVPTVSNNICGNKTLSLPSSGLILEEQPIEEDGPLDNPVDGPTLPEGVTWYWQGTDNSGTSTANPTSSTYTAISSGTYYVRAQSSVGCWSAIRSVNVTVNPIPGRPSAPSVSNNSCGNKIVTRGTPPDGVTWYWQTNPGGESTGNSSPTYSVSGSRIVHLRARSSSGCWSSVRSVGVTANPIPDQPPVPYFSNNNCGDKTLSFSPSIGLLEDQPIENEDVQDLPIDQDPPLAPPSGVIWYWQGTDDDGISTANSYTNDYTLTTSGIYYVRARSSAGCWSTIRSVNVTVNEIPDRPSMPTVSTNNCGDKTLTRATPPSGVTWYWQTSSGGESLGNSLATYSVSNSGNVHLRARSAAGCWSDSRSLSVIVNEIPDIPPVPVVSNNNCGNKTLSLPSSVLVLEEQPIEDQPIEEGPSDEPIDGPITLEGVTWYWQGTDADGTSTANPTSSTYTAMNSGTYYVRAQSDAGCWSVIQSVSVTVKPIPGIPSAPSVSDNNCGNKILTRGTPPDGVTWYWQTSEGGESTGNSSPTYSVSNSKIVHLKAMSSAGCWSSVRSVGVTINPIPDQPPVPYVSDNICGDKILSILSLPILEDQPIENDDVLDEPIDQEPVGPPIGVTWYWQGTDANGTSTASPVSSTYAATNSGIHYVRALNQSGCWSVSTGIGVTVNSIPDRPTTPSVSSNTCGNKTLTRGTPPTGVTWYWQGKNSNGNSTTNSNLTYSATSSGTYYLRAKGSGDCWGASRSVSVIIKPPTIVASKTHLNNASPAQLSTNDTCSDDLEWLLNGTLIGTGNSIEVNQPGTYTLKSGTYSSEVIITSNRTFWARNDGDWDNQIWSLTETGAIVNAYPGGNDRVNIKGKSVIAKGNQTCSYIYVLSSNTPSLLRVSGNLEVNEEVVIEQKSGRADAEVKVDSGANLKVD